MERDDTIRKYFKQNYSYNEIKNILDKYGYKISYRYLQRILQTLGLRRKQCKENLSLIINTVMKELEGSGSCLGYKAMWRRLKLQYNLKVNRLTVEKLLRVIDPEGVDGRSKYKLKRREYKVPGPNYLWHLDGYDKLKPYGLAIHGCVDGFSRKVLWLSVATTNNKPEVICCYFLRAVKKFGIVPTLVRSDNGSENVVVEGVQQALRSNHSDLAGANSFIKGKSTANQRIESSWRRMRQHSVDFWINFFKDMIDLNHYDKSNAVQVECLRFCFAALVQKDLDRTRQEWNKHSIRKQKGDNIITGKPNYLFNRSQCFHKHDYGHVVSEEHVSNAWNNFVELPKYCSYAFSQIVRELYCVYPEPRNIEEAVEMYHRILRDIKQFE